VRAIEFSEIKMHGVAARRRAAHFGFDYAYDSAAIAPGPPFPDFLLALAERLALLAGVEPDQLVEALATEYPPGAPIGWHRDAPQFGIVVAVSLVSPCRFRFRYGSSGRASATLTVEPRSAYLLSGAARSKWQHSIAPAKELRYSITFRTLRAKTNLQ
jgi:alkylated DNA repair dioxygenase AlkB